MKISKAEVKKTIAKTLAENDGITTRGMAKIINMHECYMVKLMKEMREDGEIFFSGNNREYHYHPTRELARKANNGQASKARIRVDIVAEYRANSLIYRFDKLQAAARANHD